MSDRVIDKILFVLSSILTICGVFLIFLKFKISLVLATAFMGICAYVLYKKAYR